MYHSVIEQFDNIVEKFSDKIAIANEDREVSFLEYREQSLRIASKLLEEILPNHPIAVYLPKSVECLEVFMGILYSGNYYCPIPMSSPNERAEKMIKVLNPDAIITNRVNYERVKSFVNEGVKIFLVEECGNIDIKQAEIQKIISQVIDTNPIYVLFTSGSTGTPKGVTIPHRAVIDYMEWSVKEFDLNEKLVFASQAPFHFDLSVPDIFTVLFTGAKLILCDEKLFLFPVKLIHYLNKMGVNTLNWVPSALMLLSNRNVFEKYALEHVRLVMFCGEVMPNRHLNIWRQYYPNVKFVNFYGPTEATYACTYYPVERKFRDDEPLPIGFACSNTEIFLLDEKENLVSDKIGEIGELCVRGSSLALGYYGDYDNSAFFQNPAVSAYRDIIYRTGDLAFLNERRELMYIGRKDYQIKHMGYRIELGEIETAASSMVCLKQVCVLYHAEKDEIVLFYVGLNSVSKADLKAWLKEKLPDYMMPNVYTPLIEMPYNLNGKVDRNYLKQLL